MIQPFIGPYSPQEIISNNCPIEDTTGCYIVCNKTNNLTYVGKSIHFLQRIKQHYSHASGNSCLYMDYTNGDSIEIYFVKLLDTDFDDLQTLEGYLIKLMDSVNHGYNDRNESTNDFSNKTDQYVSIIAFFDFMTEFIPMLKGWIECQFYEHDYSDTLCGFPFGILWEIFKTWCRKNNRTNCYKTKSIGLLYLWCQANIDSQWRFIPETTKINFHPDISIPAQFLGKYQNENISDKKGCFIPSIQNKEYKGGLFYNIE